MLINRKLVKVPQKKILNNSLDLFEENLKTTNYSELKQAEAASVLISCEYRHVQIIFKFFRRMLIFNDDNLAILGMMGNEIFVEFFLEI